MFRVHRLKVLKTRENLKPNCQQNKYNVDSYPKREKMNVVLPVAQKSNLSPGRQKNDELRSRTYLTIAEVNDLLQAVGSRGRHTTRDYALVLLMFRHGLRVSEAIALKWDAVMFDQGKIYLNRLKGSVSGSHPLQADEVEALQELKALGNDARLLFVGERGLALSRAAVGKILSRAGELANLPLKAHPHMLRHSCGYHLANQGMDTRLIQDWLGHKDIKNTVGYTKLNTDRFSAIAWD